MLIVLLLACTSTEVKYRYFKEEVTEVFVRKDGKCYYTIEPKQNFRVVLSDSCNKYGVGDSLVRVEQYTVQKNRH